jgi:hypothetical protein
MVASEIEAPNTLVNTVWSGCAVVQSDSVTEPWVDLQADLHAQPRRQLAEARKVLGCLE